MVPVHALPLLVRIALLMYACFAALALLGKAIFDRRRAERPDDTPLKRHELPMSAAERDRIRDRQIDRIYGEWRNNAHENAWRTLMTQVEQSAEPLDELRWLHGRISCWPDRRLANRVAQEMLPRLLAAHRYSEALSVTRRRLADDSSFRPLTAADSLRMARIARDGGDRPTARALLHDFTRFFPGDPLRPVADELMRQLER